MRGHADAETLASFVIEGVPGNPGMPGFGKTLTRDQIDDVMKYVRNR